MTREEFIEGIDYFYELRDFCGNEGIYALDNYFDGDDLDDEVDSDLGEYASDYHWTTVRDALSRIETGYDFYRRDGILDYCGCDDSDFEDLKRDVLEIMDDRGAWDESDEEDDDDEEDEEESGRMTLEELWWGTEEEMVYDGSR